MQPARIPANYSGRRTKTVKVIAGGSLRQKVRGAAAVITYLTPLSEVKNAWPRRC